MEQEARAVVEKKATFSVPGWSIRLAVAFLYAPLERRWYFPPPPGILVHRNGEYVWRILNLLLLVFRAELPFLTALGSPSVFRRHLSLQQFLPHRSDYVHLSQLDTVYSWGIQAW